MAQQEGGILTNAFTKVLDAEIASATRLGNPSADYAEHQRRMHTMASMTGARGFSVPPMDPKEDVNGKTRGQRKRAIRDAAMARVSEERAPEFMHSAARRRAESAAAAKPKRVRKKKEST